MTLLSLTVVTARALALARKKDSFPYGVLFQLLDDVCGVLFQLLDVIAHNAKVNGKRLSDQILVLLIFTIWRR